MNYPAAEQWGIYEGIVTPQRAGNTTLVHLYLFKIFFYNLSKFLTK